MDGPARLKWRHYRNPPRPEGLNSTIMNNEVSRISTFVREICQNSNDAAVENSDPAQTKRDKPVIIEFNLETVPVRDFPDRLSYCSTIQKCIDEANTYEHNRVPYTTFCTMKKIMDSGKIRVMRVSDHNTVGLSDFGTKNQLGSWNRLTVNVAISDKPEDSAGSKGVGKNSFYEMSNLKTLFFQTRNLKNECAFVGRCSFIPYHDGEDIIDSVGFYGHDDLGYSPITDESEFPPFASKRNDSGTDVFIFGYRDTSAEWKIPIIATIVKGFFISILEGDLVAIVGDRQIDKDNLDAVLNDLLARAHDGDEPDKELESLPEVIRAYREGEVFEYDDYEIRLIKSEGRGRIITTKRSTGMTVDANYSFGQCSGVIIAKGEFARKISKCENPTHTKWNPSNSDDEEIRLWAKKELNRLNGTLGNAVKKLIKSQFDESSDAAGLGKLLSVEKEGDKPEKTVPAVFGKIVLSKTTKSRKSSSDTEGNESKPLKASRTDDDDESSYAHTKRHRKTTTNTHLTPDNHGFDKTFYKGNNTVSNIRVILETDGSYVILMDSKRNTKVSIALHQVYENGNQGPRLPISEVTYLDGTPIIHNEADTIGPFEVFDLVRNKIRVKTTYPAHCSVMVEVVK